MRKVVLWACLLVAAKAQEIWIERSTERLPPKLSAQAFRLSSTEWVIVASLPLEAWLPYAFDSLLPVQARLVRDQTVLAETTLAFPTSHTWQGSWRWKLPLSQGGEWVGLYMSCPDAPEGPYFTRVFLPVVITSAWIEAPTPHLSNILQVCESEGKKIQLRLGDTLWRQYFSPALVDTSLPLPPYVLKTLKRSVRSPSPCAWHWMGDTTRVFWTCFWPGNPYPAPGASSRTIPPIERWREAFFLFSEGKPGDRTDRGLVYLFWGPPPLRLLTLSSEVWVYPHENVSFHFVYRGGGWQLLRKLEYQAVWKKE